MNTGPGKVSIVLPTFNGTRFLRGAVESCLSQTYQNFELIVVDDCSTDATPDILRQFQDPRVVVVRNIKNQRLPRSLNIGFARATGDYLTWTSDDNEYEPNTIQKLVETLRAHPEADFVYADYWAWYEDGRRERVRLEEPLNLSERNGVGCAFLYTKRVMETLGGYEPNLEMVEDYDYWIRIAKRFKTVHLAEPVYLYRYHGGSLTSTRRHNQALFHAIALNRHGYWPLKRVAAAGTDYFRDVLQSEKPGVEKRRLVSGTLQKVFALSPAYGTCFVSAVGAEALRRRLAGAKR